MSKLHAFTIAAIRSGEGKTTVSLGLMRLLSRRFKTQAFKCGPDYIDPTFHEMVTDRPCYNLDTWIMGKDEVKRVFTEHTKDVDCAICEGVMGLFDGKIQPKKSTSNQEDSFDCSSHLPSLEGSSAHIAQLLDIPIVLVVNAKGMASSIAPLVEGFVVHSKRYGLKLAGIIANNVGSERHAQILKEALENWQLPPLIGHLPRKNEWSVDDRQLGLVPLSESKKNIDWADAIADTLEKNVDLDLLLNCTSIASDTEIKSVASKNQIHKKINKILGVARDKSFCFYYHENFKALEKLGWKIKFFSPLEDKQLPSADALYFGGGYPEIFTEQLSSNISMRTAVKNFAENNGHIFAECGGYMYLTNELILPEKNVSYPLCGVINAKAVMGNRLKSLGYREMTLCENTIFSQNNFDTKIFRGHEFHWSDIELLQEYKPFVMLEYKPYGIAYKNVRASYLHFYWGNMF